VRIRGTHVTTAEQQQFPPLDILTPDNGQIWPKHVVTIKNPKNFKNFEILNFKN
jgi:hypothetical protein